MKYTTRDMKKKQIHKIKRSKEGCFTVIVKDGEYVIYGDYNTVTGFCAEMYLYMKEKGI